MKKALTHTFIVFLISHIIIIATYNIGKYSNYGIGEATVVEKMEGRYKVLEFKVKGSRYEYEYPYLNTFLLLNDQDKVEIKYLESGGKEYFSDVVIPSVWLNLFTIDKIVLKCMLFIVMFGSLSKIYSSS